jgi:hypothetical protein
MSDTPELRDYVEGFTERYTSRTEAGFVLNVTDEELSKFGNYVVRGFVDWVGRGQLNDGDFLYELGESLEVFSDQSAPDGSLGAAMQVTDKEVIGMGIFLARSFVGWLLRLDQDRGRFKRFDDVIELEKSGDPGLLFRRLIARAI